jgi:uncharacterized hydrophobic protein (TIGR00271 family)
MFKLYFLDKLKSLWKGVYAKLDILHDSAPLATVRDIDANIEIKGYNIWILVCSALLASIGLDTNSTAVIIGAMLISPLMSPILGVGLGFGINNRQMLERSGRNLLIATIASLLASWLYFAFTPLGEITPEISGRTKPTLLDVLVAFFGGVAGVVSGSRKEKTNAIPGVAIATALMPPLCSAGFGLAKMEWTVFLGAFYLFFINAVFISLSTYLIVRYLKFNEIIKAERKARVKVLSEKAETKKGLSVDEQAELAQVKMEQAQELKDHQKRFFARLIPYFLVAVIAPSIYFLVTFIQEQRTKNRIEEVVNEQLKRKAGFDIIRSEVVDKGSKKEIKLYISAQKEITQLEKRNLNDELNRNGLGDYTLNISRINITKDEIDELNSKIVANFFDLKNNFTTLETKFDSLQKAQLRIQQQRTNIDFLAHISKELQIFYPLVDSMTVSPLPSFLVINDTKRTSNRGTRSSVEIRDLKHFKLDWEGVFPDITRLDSTELAALRNGKSNNDPHFELAWTSFFPKINQIKKSEVATTTNKTQKDKSSKQPKVSTNTTDAKKQRSVTTVTLFWQQNIDQELPIDNPLEQERIKRYFMTNLKLDSTKSELKIKHFVIQPSNEEKEKEKQENEATPNK